MKVEFTTGKYDTCISLTPETVEEAAQLTGAQLNLRKRTVCTYLTVGQKDVRFSVGFSHYKEHTGAVRRSA